MPLDKELETLKALQSKVRELIQEVPRSLAKYVLLDLLGETINAHVGMETLFKEDNDQVGPRQKILQILREKPENSLAEIANEVYGSNHVTEVKKVRNHLWQLKRSGKCSHPNKKTWKAIEPKNEVLTLHDEIEKIEITKLDGSFGEIFQ